MAGAAIPVGALIARYEHIRPDWLEKEFRHSVIAFGGGVLLSAVSLVLVPEGMRKAGFFVLIASMVAGGLAFMVLDRFLAARKTPASQLAAMLADFLPEAIALGATILEGASTASLLALLIALQNVPEGFNAFREIKTGGAYSDRKILIVFALLSLLGPMCGLGGLYLLSGREELIGAIMLFASGGILYLTFQDIAPQAKLERYWAPPLGAVLGFLFGACGQYLIG